MFSMIFKPSKEAQALTVYTSELMLLIKVISSESQESALIRGRNAWTKIRIIKQNIFWKQGISQPFKFAGSSFETSVYSICEIKHKNRSLLVLNNLFFWDTFLEYLCTAKNTANKIKDIIIENIKIINQCKGWSGVNTLSCKRRTDFDTKITALCHAYLAVWIWYISG